MMNRWEMEPLSVIQVNLLHVNDKACNNQELTKSQGVSSRFDQFETLKWLADHVGAHGDEGYAFLLRAGSKNPNPDISTLWVDYLVEPELLNAVLSIPTSDDTLTNIRRVREFLMGQIVRGLVRGPLRHCMRRIAEVDGKKKLDHLHLDGFKWCGAVKLKDGRLVFIPRGHKGAQVRSCVTFTSYQLSVLRILCT